MARSEQTASQRATLHVSVDTAMLARLKEEAEREGVTTSELARKLLEEALDQEEEDHLLAEAAEAAFHDPKNQEHIPWEQAKAELGL